MSVCYLLKPNSPSQKNIWHIDFLKKWLLFQLNGDSHRAYRHSNGTLDGVRTKRVPTMLKRKLVTKRKIGHLVLLYLRYDFRNGYFYFFYEISMKKKPFLCEHFKIAFLGWPTKSSYWSSVDWQDTKETFTLLGLHFRWQNKSKNCKDSNATYWRSM